MPSVLRDYLILCKPRVVLLMLFTAWAGMYLAPSGSLSFPLFAYATLGIALMSGAAATINHIIDHKIDALMERTKLRPIATGRVKLREAFIFAGLQGLVGFAVLFYRVNEVTAYMTLIAAIGYAAIYSIYLKRATPQNIVIGGLSGAMPPLLGWTAATGKLDPEAWLLVLIIFTWTPAHFWALCLYRYNEYKKAPYPMLPITHGVPYTKLNILLYSLLTLAASFLPYAIGLSGDFYFVSILLLNMGSLYYAVKLLITKEDTIIALKTFRFSLIYLTGLFLAILIDHYLTIT